jgi:GNAT superfamily N-acetyltransferase
MRYHLEKLHDNLPALDVFVRDYFDRTKAKEGVPPIDMDWDQYLLAEDKDRLALFTARTESAKLCGFAMYVVTPNPHYKTVTFATCDILAVSPDYRSLGIARMLIRSAEGVFSSLGVDRMIHYFRTVYDVEPLFTKLGFVEAERTYMKVL